MEYKVPKDFILSQSARGYTTGLQETFAPFKSPIRMFKTLFFPTLKGYANASLKERDYRYKVVAAALLKYFNGKPLRVSLHSIHRELLFETPKHLLRFITQTGCTVHQSAGGTLVLDFYVTPTGDERVRYQAPDGTTIKLGGVHLTDIQL